MNDLLREESIFFYIESSGSVRTEIVKVRTISYIEILVFVFKDLKISFLISQICIFRTGFVEPFNRVHPETSPGC